MKYLVSLLALLSLTVTAFAQQAIDYDNTTIRFRIGSILKFDAGTTIQDEDAAWTISASELSYLDGVTSALQTQLNAKTGATNGVYEGGTFTGGTNLATIFSDLTASRAVVSGAGKALASSSVTTTELGYVSGVTSAIQTQLDSKVAKAGDTMTGTLTVTGLTNSALTASRAVVSGADKTLASSAVTTTELGYVGGVTSAIQTQLDARVLKAGDTMTGTLLVTGLTNNALTASLPIWAAADKSMETRTVAASKTALGIQVGSGVSAADGTVTNTFATVFGAVPIIVITPLSDAALTNSTSAKTESNFVAHVGVEGVTIDWIAIGAP